MRLYKGGGIGGGRRWDLYGQNDKIIEKILKIYIMSYYIILLLLHMMPIAKQGLAGD